MNKTKAEILAVDSDCTPFLVYSFDVPKGMKLAIEDGPTIIMNTSSDLQFNITYQNDEGIWKDTSLELGNIDNIKHAKAVYTERGFIIFSIEHKTQDGYKIQNEEDLYNVINSAGHSDCKTIDTTADNITLSNSFIKYTLSPNYHTSLWNQIPSFLSKDIYSIITFDEYMSRTDSFQKAYIVVCDTRVLKIIDSNVIWCYNSIEDARSTRCIYFHSKVAPQIGICYNSVVDVVDSQSGLLSKRFDGCKGITVDDFLGIGYDQLLMIMHDGSMNIYPKLDTQRVESTVDNKEKIISALRSKVIELS